MTAIGAFFNYSPILTGHCTCRTCVPALQQLSWYHKMWHTVEIASRGHAKAVVSDVPVQASWHGGWTMSGVVVVVKFLVCWMGTRAEGVCVKGQKWFHQYPLPQEYAE